MPRLRLNGRRPWVAEFQSHDREGPVHLELHDLDEDRQEVGHGQVVCAETQGTGPDREPHGRASPVASWRTFLDHTACVQE